MYFTVLQQKEEEEIADRQEEQEIADRQEEESHKTLADVFQNPLLECFR